MVSTASLTKDSITKWFTSLPLPLDSIVTSRVVVPPGDDHETCLALIPMTLDLQTKLPNPRAFKSFRSRGLLLGK